MTLSANIQELTGTVVAIWGNLAAFCRSGRVQHMRRNNVIGCTISMPPPLVCNFSESTLNACHGTLWVQTLVRGRVQSQGRISYDRSTQSSTCRATKPQKSPAARSDAGYKTLAGLPYLSTSLRHYLNLRHAKIINSSYMNEFKLCSRHSVSHVPCCEAAKQLRAEDGLHPFSHYAIPREKSTAIKRTAILALDLNA